MISVQKQAVVGVQERQLDREEQSLRGMTPQQCLCPGLRDSLLCHQGLLYLEHPALESSCLSSSISRTTSLLCDWACYFPSLSLGSPLRLSCGRKLIRVRMK